MAGTALVAVSASAGWRANDRSDSDFAEWYAAVLFDLLPPNAVMFVHGDASGPLGYYRYVEEHRPDIALYNLHGLVFGDRLYDPLLLPEERRRCSTASSARPSAPCSSTSTADMLPRKRLRRRDNGS